MDHIAYVGLVYAHAEGDGGDHYHAGASHELVLVEAALGCAHASVIRERGDASFGKVFCHLLGVFAREAIDDAALPGTGSYELDDAIRSGSLADIDFHAEADVGAVETSHEQLSLLAEELAHDVVACGLIGCGGESPDRHIRQVCRELGEGFVFGSEGRSPL